MVSSKFDKGGKQAVMYKSAARLHLGCALGFDPLSKWLPANEKPDRQTLQFEVPRRGVGKPPAKTLGRDGLIVHLMAQDAPPPQTDEDLAHYDAAQASQPRLKSPQNDTDSDEGETRNAGAAAGEGDAKRAQVEPALVVPILPHTGGGVEEDVAAEKFAASGESEAGAAKKTGKAAGKGKGEATKADDGTANWRTNNGSTQLVNIIIALPRCSLSATGRSLGSSWTGRPRLATSPKTTSTSLRSSSSTTQK